MTDDHLVPIRRDNANMARSLFDVIGIPFERTSELERQVVATIAFGMVFAMGRIRHLSPPEVHALSICVLVDAFRYADHQASDFTTDPIEVASDESRQPLMNAIIHRGIDGHQQWQSGNTDGLRANLSDVLKRVRTSESRDRPTRS